VTLSALIRKRGTGNLATAIPAIFATHGQGNGVTVARIATVAVANPLKAKTAPPEISPEKGKTVPPANVAANDPAHASVIEAVPHERRAASCPSCTHFRRPGYSAGYCGSPERRADLPPAYGEGHPLRQLPDDQGKSCRAAESPGLGEGTIQ
jgi:hypothetical protein